MKIKLNKVYDVKYNGKYVINYAWREPQNPNKWILCDEPLNSIPATILLEMLKAGVELEIREVKF